jgi:hypothetical protein
MHQVRVDRQGCVGGVKPLWSGERLGEEQAIEGVAVVRGQLCHAAGGLIRQWQPNEGVLLGLRRDDAGSTVKSARWRPNTIAISQRPEAASSTKRDRCVLAAWVLTMLPGTSLVQSGLAYFKRDVSCWPQPDRTANSPP